VSPAVSVVLAAGGSGGHIQPALACAAAIRHAEPTAAISVLGSVRGLEGRVVPASGWELDTVPAVPLPRRPGADLIALTPRLLSAVRAAGRVLRRRRADVVVGFGGYAALPGYLAARRAGIPIVVHEANPVPGIANRIGARLTTHVFTAGAPTAPDTAPLRHAVALGMPVRAQLTGLDRLSRRPTAAAAVGRDPHRPTLVVTGGSQGARRLNEAVLGAAARLSAAGIGVLHLLGPDNPLPDPADTPAGYVALGYVEAMEDVYAVADLVLCRAGMTTVAELAILGLPAVFVPLPIGNGEQRRNAESLVSAGAAVVIEDGELTADRIAALVPGLLTDPYRLTAMAAAARAAGTAAGHRDAATALAAAVLQVAHAHAERSVR
jgi:UDP-N-acetylglucosamine--N-acetylmuramyl-(pentapeptide) pyrophosphoryl-undecaprenol N-acetylglucosamine transferase